MYLFPLLQWGWAKNLPSPVTPPEPFVHSSKGTRESEGSTVWSNGQSVSACPVKMCYSVEMRTGAGKISQVIISYAAPNQHTEDWACLKPKVMTSFSKNGFGFSSSKTLLLKQEPAFLPSGPQVHLLRVAKDSWVSLQYNQCHHILYEVDTYKSQKGMTHRRTMAKSLEKREWTPSVNLLCYFCGGVVFVCFLFPWCIQRQVVQKFAQNPSVFNS